MALAAETEVVQQSEQQSLTGSLAPGKAAAAKTRLQQCYRLVQELRPDGLPGSCSISRCVTLGWLKHGKSVDSTAEGAPAALRPGALDNHSPFAPPAEGQ